MQYIDGLLALGGDLRNTVPLSAVSVAEVHLLRAIHGPDSVHDVQPLPGVNEVQPRGEIARLIEKYPATDEDGLQVARRVFAGGAPSVPVEIADLDLPEAAFRVVQRVAAPAPKRKRAPAAEPGSAVVPVGEDAAEADEVFG